MFWKWDKKWRKYVGILWSEPGSWREANEKAVSEGGLRLLL